MEVIRKYESNFEKLRSRCLETKKLVVPDFTKRFRAAIDRSVDGRGVHIYQLKDPSKCALLEADLDPSSQNTIMDYSKVYARQISI